VRAREDECERVKGDTQPGLQRSAEDEDEWRGKEERSRRGAQAGRDAAEGPRGRGGKGERRGGEDTARSRYDPAERGRIRPWKPRARARARASVVEPTLSRALCPVLVGISGAPTGPSAVSPII